MTNRKRGPLGLLRRHQLAVGAATFAGLAAITTIALISTTHIPLLPSYQLHATLPRDASPILVGDEVRVAGQVTGVVAGVRASQGGQLVSLDLHSDVAPVGRDARLVVRQRSAAGSAYLQLIRGDYAARPLPSGSDIPPTQVSDTTTLLDVVQGFDGAALRALSASLRLGGYGLLDRGPDLNVALAGLGSTLSSTAGELRAAASTGELTTLVGGLDRTVIGLGGQSPGDAGALVTGAARTFSALAESGPAITDTLRQLPPAEQQALRTLPVADQLLERLDGLEHGLSPALAAIDHALPSINGLLSRGTVLRTQVAALRAPATVALRALTPPLGDLAPVATLFRLAIGPLGPVAGYLSLYRQEIESGLAAFYALTNYRPLVGQAPGTPTVPALVVLTCASGRDPADPTPGAIFNERLSRPCR